MTELVRKSCPACFDQYLEPFAFCPKDGAQLQKLTKERTPNRDGRICPECRRCYGADMEFCPRDSEQLVPFGLFAAQASVAVATSEAPGLCQRCGLRGSVGQVFCAMDGERLVALH